MSHTTSPITTGFAIGKIPPPTNRNFEEENEGEPKISSEIWNDKSKIDRKFSGKYPQLGKLFFSFPENFQILFVFPGQDQLTRAQIDREIFKILPKTRTKIVVFGPKSRRTCPRKRDENRKFSFPIHNFPVFPRLGIFENKSSDLLPNFIVKAVNSREWPAPPPFLRPRNYETPRSKSNMAASTNTITNCEAMVQNSSKPSTNLHTG